jgi:hypothetical protein
LKNKTSQPFFQNQGCESRLIQKHIFKYVLSQSNGPFYFQVIFSFTFPQRSTAFQPELILFYTMATHTLKWPLRIGAPKTTGDSSMFSDNEGPNPNANNTPTFFTIKHYKWLLQYQQLFQFYLVHGQIFDLYSAGIFSGISFEIQNGLPSRMHQLSIAQGVSNIHPMLTNHGVPDSFQLPTAKYPNNYGVLGDGVPDSLD